MRTFIQALSGEVSEGVILWQSKPPYSTGGNIMITVDEDEYSRGLLQFTHTLISRIIFTKGNSPLKKDDLKRKLYGIWKLREVIWRLTPLGRGYFNIHLTSHIKKISNFCDGGLFSLNLASLGFQSGNKTSTILTRIRQTHKSGCVGMNYHWNIGERQFYITLVRD